MCLGDPKAPSTQYFYECVFTKYFNFLYFMPATLAPMNINLWPLQACTPTQAHTLIYN